MNTPLIKTKRLILRKFTENDLEALYLILSDKDVNLFLPWYPVKNFAETLKFYKEKYEKIYLESKGYAYAICLKSNNYPIGYINISMDDSHDLGYAIRKEYQNQGIVTEAAIAIIEQVRKDGLEYITATHDVNNPQSGKVMRKIGMKYCYTYEELWQPKNKQVFFRMYQLNFDNSKKEYSKYKEIYKNHFIEEI